MESPGVRNGFSMFRSRIESDALRAIADHWDQVRQPSRLPSWSDLRPSRIAPHLTRVWCYRYDRDTGEFTARLAGSQVTNSIANFRGTPLRDIHPPHIYEKVHALMVQVVEGPRLYRCKGDLFRLGDVVANGERIMLPLASDGVHGDGALGASDYPPLPVADQQFEAIMENTEWFSLAD